jgi:hypothetical protein
VNSAGAPKIADLQAGSSFGAPRATIAILPRARAGFCRGVKPLTNDGGASRGAGSVEWDGIDETVDVDDVVSRAGGGRRLPRAR